MVGSLFRCRSGPFKGPSGYPDGDTIYRPCRNSVPYRASDLDRRCGTWTLTSVEFSDSGLRPRAAAAAEALMGALLAGAITPRRFAQVGRDGRPSRR